MRGVRYRQETPGGVHVPPVTPEVKPILSRRSRVSAWSLVVALAACVALPGSAFAASAPLPAAPAEDVHAAGDFAMNLYRKR